MEKLPLPPKEKRIENRTARIASRSLILSLLFIGLSFSLIFSCRYTNSSEGRENNMEPDSLMESFMAFYQQFHRDSLFQINHIIFPLEGLPDNADSLTIALGNFRWKKEEWKMQKPFDFEFSEYGRKISQPAPGIIEEIIYHKKLPYLMTRRFSHFNGEWYLIYYAGMNRIRVQSEGE